MNSVVMRRMRRLAVVAAVLITITLPVDRATAAPTNSGPIARPTGLTVNDRVGERNRAVKRVQDRGRTLLGRRFAGVFLEGRTVVVRTTEAPAGSTKHSLQALLSTSGHGLAFRAASNSQVALDKLVTRISDDLGPLDGQGIEIRTVDADVVRNAVRVGVAAKDVARGRQVLPRRYRDATLYVEAQGPARLASRSDSPGLFKAGLQIRRGDGVPCTSGFAVRDDRGNRHALTAGHCGDAGSIWTHGGGPLGRMARSTYHDGVDGAMIDLDLGLSSNWLFHSDDNLEPIHSFTTAPTGSSVCAEGITSGERCGTVMSTNSTLSVRGRPTLRGMHRVRFGSRPGDSGGPVYQFTTGVGIVSATDDSTTWYTPVQRVADRFGVVALTRPQPKTLTIDHSSKCVDVDIARTLGNGADVQQWDCLGLNQKNQSFFPDPVYDRGGRWSGWYSIAVQHTWRCVDVDIARTLGNGAKVQQWDCNGWWNQQFRPIRGPGLSISWQARHSGRCLDLDISRAPFANGTKLQQWDCNGWRNQRFTLLER